MSVSLDNLSNSVLHIPDLPAEVFEVTILESEGSAKTDILLDRELSEFPLAASFPFSATLVEACNMSHGEDVKEIYSLKLSYSNAKYDFVPGGTIGIIPVNTDEEIMLLFRQLQIEDKAKYQCKVSRINNIKKASGIAPRFLKEIITVEDIFKNCLDIRCLPKKLLIRVLAEYTENIQERRELEELCSKEGSQKYTKMIIECKTTFLDLILSFPSCKPPIGRLFEQLPRLLPRPYSIASSHLETNELLIMFSVVRLSGNVVKRGLCTGMLEEMAKQWLRCREASSITVYFRKVQNFILPLDSVKPLIFIGPGTGVAPFIGVLRCRETLGLSSHVTLLCGCRYRERDQLYKELLQGYLKDGTLTELYLAVSREGGGPRHVQDWIAKRSGHMAELLLRREASVFVCGDARGMSRDVRAAWVRVLQEDQGLSEIEATKQLDVLQVAGRYMEDVWC